jgi:hypothetical protein
MPEDFSKNFIPQKRVDPRRAGLRIYSTVDTLTAVAVILFSTVIFIIIGIYGSRFFIDKQAESLQVKVSDLSGQFNSMEVSELVVLDKKVNAVVDVIDKHTSITNIREFLEDHTQSRVRVISYSFSETGEDSKGTGTLVITGEALNYNTLANQQNIYVGDEDVIGVTFTDIKPTDTGMVAFTATMNLKESVFSYNALSQ